ncbi:uncharacterized protein RHO25_010810 [Cercospora beticola]|uniref:NmrA-like domain-containing protein n=1 Tax=Cercospora beticola TaxID=122368 RepID=A0ABZ0P2S5_CERBT|nr:hypothetical protein RHO25_010810 [Cercospora beticola]CAK1366037.1 unnamed protein product [Cercospora beticola]
MVAIAIAGASGSVAQEVIDGLVATGKHEILLLSRNEPPKIESRSGCRWLQTSYTDAAQLAEAFKKTHTVLSFITTQSDPDNATQRALIDASILAGVKRFAPSEWATAHNTHMPWYSGKDDIRVYLESINQTEKRLSYTLFQPGLFPNYFLYPHKHSSSPHFNPFETHIDFANCRALVLSPDGENDRLTLTTLEDLVKVVVHAVDYGGEWPVTGGIKGTEISIGELIKIGERVRGRPFDVEYLQISDLEAGNITSSWLPVIDHPAFTPEQARALAEKLLSGMVLGIRAGD